jgi:hypothetical protein
MAWVKEDFAAFLRKFPEDCTIGQLHYHLNVLEKVRHGLARADADGTIPQDEAEARLSRWLTE